MTQRQGILSKSSSRQALKSLANLNLQHKKRRSRPTSGNRSNSKKKQNNSQNKSRSKDRSKQLKLKENSSHLKKTDENLLLKSMKNTYKASSFGKLLDAIEDKENHFTKPPKAQKISNVCFKDGDILNLERIGIKKSRSRQHNNLNKKSNTIQVSPKKEGKEEGLDYQKNALKRKSSHHADFSKYSGKNTKLKQAFSNPKICGSLKSLYSSNKESEIAKKLKSSITDHTESISIIKRSIMDTSNS